MQRPDDGDVSHDQMVKAGRSTKGSQSREAETDRNPQEMLYDFPLSLVYSCPQF